jgi:ankyrin repeat protein
VRLLLDRGASIDLVVPGDENALIQAAWHGRLDVVRLLLERGADPNVRVFEGMAVNRPRGEWRTALSMARRHRHAAIAEALIAAGARE